MISISPGPGLVFQTKLRAHARRTTPRWPPGGVARHDPPPGRAPTRLSAGAHRAATATVARVTKGKKEASRTGSAAKSPKLLASDHHKAHAALTCNHPKGRRQMKDNPQRSYQTHARWGLFPFPIFAEMPICAPHTSRAGLGDFRSQRRPEYNQATKYSLGLRSAGLGSIREVGARSDLKRPAATLRVLKNQSHNFFYDKSSRPPGDQPPRSQERGVGGSSKGRGSVGIFIRDFLGTGTRGMEMSGGLFSVEASVSLADQIAGVERELALRRRLYPGWVRAGSMTQSFADKQLAVMEAVLATLNRVRAS